MYLYSALFVPLTQSAQAWITQVYLQLHQCLPLPRKHSLDGAPILRLRTSTCSLLLIYLPRKYERPGWLTYSGRFTHISGHPSAVGRAQDRESSPVKSQHCITVRRKQPNVCDWKGGKAMYMYIAGKLINSVVCMSIPFVPSISCSNVLLFAVLHTNILHCSK